MEVLRRPSWQRFFCCQLRILLMQGGKKLFHPLDNTQSGKVNFLCNILDEGNNLVGQFYLSRESPAVVQYVDQVLLYNFSQVFIKRI